MEPDQLLSLLAGFTAQLQAATAKEKSDLQEIQEALASTLINRSGSGLEFQSYVFEHSDLFSAQKLDVKQLEQLKSVVRKISLPENATEIQAVIRETAVKSTQLGGDIAKTVAGARVTKTIGPIKRVDGREIFVDFINIRKLIALYIQGQTTPAILFNASFRTKVLIPVGSKPELVKEYKIVPDSVWVNAKLLASNAPAGLYCGLRVKSGKITLDTFPVYTNNQLTVAATSNISVSLELEQKTGFENDATSAYGADARNAVVELPKTFAFSLKGSTKNIQQVGDSRWEVYGQSYNLSYQNEQGTIYNGLISRLAIPVKCGLADFNIQKSVSPFLQLDGSAPIKSTWWTIPAAQIDITKPLEADGNGGFVFECTEGIFSRWGKTDEKTALKAPFFIGEPGRIGITDAKSNGSGISQKLDTWKDEQNPFGTTIDINFRKDATYVFNTVAKGDELLFTVADSVMNVDRPVKVNGEAVTVRSKNSLIVLAVNKIRNAIGIIDDNILWDNKLPAQKIPVVKPFALAMHNALFTVTPANGSILFGNCDKDFTSIEQGNLYISFGLFSYLPTLPDPYAANLGIMKEQFLSDNRKDPNGKSSRVFMWLVSRTQWLKEKEGNDQVGVSFHFAPLASALQIEKESKSPKTQNPALSAQTGFKNVFGTLGVKDVPKAAAATFSTSNQDTTAMAYSATGARGNTFQLEDFTLLDVSSKANQMGVAYCGSNVANKRLFSTFDIKINDQDNTAQAFPIQVSGLDVVTPGYNARAFTVPQIAWEPVMNFTPPAPDPTPSPAWPNPTNDPPLGFNYYPNDGFATRIGNFSKKTVALSPIPMAKYLEQVYKDKEDGKTYAIFNLPFGMLAITLLDNFSAQTKKPTVKNIQPIFEKYINGGIQLELTAGTSLKPEDDLFQGYTAQLINVQDIFGNTNKWSTLGSSVEDIFNGEFSKPPTNPNDKSRPAVPLKRVGLSGYGASIFSDWHNKDAAFAETSQALFNVATGRTSHEVVQVKSIIYPWGIFVVRTVTLFRLNNGYVGRVDSGWKAESDGKFYFNTKNQPNPYDVHPGIIKGLYNIKNIRENTLTYAADTVLKNGDTIFNGQTNKEETYTGPTKTLQNDVRLRGLNFDCDIDIEGTFEGGGDNNGVPSKGVLGFVQLSPRGAPMSVDAFNGLLKSQQNSIGGPVNCSIKVAGTNQVMKLSRVDMNSSVSKTGTPVFVAAARGSVVLSKDGSWSMVTHNRGDGTVTPLPQNLSVPLIRIGKWDKGSLVDAADLKNLVRIAHPTELLRDAVAETINYGFLQNLNSQKVLYLTPAFKTGINSLLSKTPPLLADAYRLMNTNAVFPNIGDAESNFGTAIQMLNGKAGDTVLQAFDKVVDGGNVLDGGKQVLEILEIKTKEEAGKLLDQGFKLIKQKGNDLLNDAFKFDLPNVEYPLVGDKDSPFRIYIEYKAKSNPKKAPKDYIGNMDFDVDSFAGDMTKQWKGRLNNLAMIVDLGPLKELMKIKGNFNASKGAETDFGSTASGDESSFPTPEIEFSKDLEPVIKILEILSQLSQGNYADALKKGLKVAMSNNANIWEYKFEATKDIPLVRFPPGTLYESPQTPLKLEASMSLGVYFNAALKVTTDPKQLLPTAGAFFKFHGGLQVMCVSVGAGTIYAVGNVDLKLAADTSPLIALTMKFGFGAQVGVGLPVIGNVSILFMVGVEIYVDSTQKVAVTAFLLFRGHAEILGGLIGVTITIEAKGTIEKAGDGQPANCKASVTFALDISIFLVIDISFSESWEETRQIA